MLIKRQTIKNIDFAIYQDNGKFTVYVGGIKRTVRHTLSGANNVIKHIVENN